MRFQQVLNVVNNLQLRVCHDCVFAITQISMPLRSRESRKIVQLQQLIRGTYTDPMVIARLLPNKQEVICTYIEFHGPVQLNFIVDCVDEEDRFVQVLLEGEISGGEQEEEEEDDFELEDE